MRSDPYIRLLRDLAGELRALDARSERRTLEHVPGINLCSNDYLRLASHPGLRHEVVRAVQESPLLGSTGSRLLSGHFDVWDELEADFARFARTEAALYFGLGYAANIGLLTSLLRKNDVAFSDAYNHASLIDGIRLSGARRVIYPHLDLNVLEMQLRKYAKEDCRKVIVSESVFGMDGDCAPIRTLLELGAKYDAGLIVDEAHATAVHGPSGRGLVVAAGAESEVWAVVHSCGKALAGLGAVVCGSELLKQTLVNRARTLLFSTATPPYMARQIRASLRIAQPMDAERAALFERSLGFAAALRGDGWDTGKSTSQIVPVILGDNASALDAAEHLRVAGFAVRAVRPPSVPQGQARLRLSLTCGISAEDLRRLCESLVEWRGMQPKRAAAVPA
jgi:8-amino-7-oxononanoate synthase